VIRRDHLGPVLVVAALIIAGAVVVVIVAEPSSGPRRVRPPPAPVTSTRQSGVNVNRLFDDFAYTSAQIDGQLASLAATGATLARSDALWEATEPEPPVGGVHHYDWRFDDLIATTLAMHGLRWLPIVDYTALWAQSIPGADHSPPSSFADYAAYAGALAARYGSGGTFWREHSGLPELPVLAFEIWNEPDDKAFWTPTPDPRRYGLLYADARAAIKAVDPAALALVGGLTHPARFLSAMLASEPDLRSEIDGVAIHPYAPDPAGVISNVVAARRALESLGLGAAPLYVTEFGWTTQPVGAISYLPEHLRPGYIADTVEGLARTGCGVAAAVLYTWVTPERDPSNSQDWFGINPPHGGGSADVTAFTGAVRAAERGGGSSTGCG
jgi:hypothetical protein